MRRLLDLLGVEEKPGEVLPEAHLPFDEEDLRLVLGVLGLGLDVRGDGVAGRLTALFLNPYVS